MITEDILLKMVVDKYLTSGDFNGFPICCIEGRDEMKIKVLIKRLIQDCKVDVVFGDYHPNPHVKAFETDTREEQISKLDGDLFSQACIYPHPDHLKNIVDQSKYKDIPFTLCLALGEPRLSYKPFDLTILEIYRNDPRYYYYNDDIHGRIGITDKYSESAQMSKSDQVFLETFGFCYDEEFNRYIAAYLGYLSRLSPEHQLIWNSKKISLKTYLHPDYWRTTLGHWPERTSIFSAFMEEQRIINQIAQQIDRPPFFKCVFTNHNRPREFGFLLRPTLSEYNDFVLLLDKTISENINKAFFQSEVPYEDEEIREDGKIIIKPRGTLRILEEWLKANFITSDWDLIEDMFKTFKKIRKQRQKPAHAINENSFDNKYIHEQRELMKSSYRAMKILRTIFQNHPLANGIKISQRVDEGKIWSL